MISQFDTVAGILTYADKHEAMFGFKPVAVELNYSQYKRLKDWAELTRAPRQVSTIVDITEFYGMKVIKKGDSHG